VACWLTLLSWALVLPGCAARVAPRHSSPAAASRVGPARPALSFPQLEAVYRQRVAAHITFPR